MSLRTGLSGLNAASTDLNVIGNNVSNANTVGFKRSSAHFADAYAASIANVAPTKGQVGIGTQVAKIATNYAQGNLTVTNNPLDLAISGGGFFRVSDNGSIAYSRNGQFSVDKDGYIVNDSGARLTGYQVANGGISGALDDLRVDTKDVAPKATDNMTLGITFPANASALDPALFNANDPSTYNHSTSTAVYDSLGVSHLMTTYFIKDSTSAANPASWEVRYELEGSSTALPGSTLSFDNNGNISGGATGTLPPVTWDSGAANSTIAYDFGASTLYDAPFGVNSMAVNGNASGRLTSLSVSPDGNVFARYSNGESKTLGQIALSNFNNPNGLQPEGNNMWSESFHSGKPLTGAPGSASLGAIQSGAVEASNVDLTEELVNMIVSQRNYQANAQTIKTEDQLLQTLLNIR